MIKRLHKSSQDDICMDATLEFREGQRELLCSNDKSSRCPSLDLSVQCAKDELIAQGIPEPKVEEITDYVKSLIRHVIKQTLNNNMEYEDKRQQ